MKFIADEGVDATLVELLREASHDVFYFAESEQSTGDAEILKVANEQERILITRDKDFGELAYRMEMVHAGIVLVRLEELKSKTRSQIVFDFIAKNEAALENSFVVISAGIARVRKLNEP